MPNVDTQKVIEYLQSKWKQPCPLCGERKWVVQDVELELREFHGGPMVLSGPVMPVIPVVCGNCGNTILVNTLVTGLDKAAVLDKTSEPDRTAEPDKTAEKEASS